MSIPMPYGFSTCSRELLRDTCNLYLGCLTVRGLSISIGNLIETIGPLYCNDSWIIRVLVSHLLIGIVIIHASVTRFYPHEYISSWYYPTILVLY